jgi:hypothetical protein
MRRFNVAIGQEPWTYKGKLTDCGEVGGELIYSKYSQHLRTCILVKKGFQILPLMNHCSRDLTAMKFKTSTDDPILEMRSDQSISVYHHSRLFKFTIDLDYWKNRDPFFPTVL